MDGLHILAELRDCPDIPALRDAQALAALCRRICSRAGLSPVTEAFHQFPGAGATGAVVLAESHLAIHTWPELGAVTFDLYVCNYSRDNQGSAELAYTALVEALQPGRVQRRALRRGGLPGS